MFGAEGINLDPTTIRRIAIWGVVGTFVLATLRTAHEHWQELAAAWDAIVWTHIPPVIREMTLQWGVFILLALLVTAAAWLISMLVRRVNAARRGNRVMIFGAGGGGVSVVRRVLKAFSGADRAHFHSMLIAPLDGAKRAWESLISRVSRDHGRVYTPPGQSDESAAARAHNIHSRTYKPVVRRIAGGVTHVAAIFHLGGHTGSHASIASAAELLGRESAVFIAGDSPHALAAAMADSQLYANALRWEQAAGMRVRAPTRRDIPVGAAE